MQWFVILVSFYFPHGFCPDMDRITMAALNRARGRTETNGTNALNMMAPVCVGTDILFIYSFFFDSSPLGFSEMADEIQSNRFDGLFRWLFISMMFISKVYVAVCSYVCSIEQSSHHQLFCMENTIFLGSIFSAYLRNQSIHKAIRMGRNLWKHSI